MRGYSQEMPPPESRVDSATGPARCVRVTRCGVKGRGVELLAEAAMGA